MSDLGPYCIGMFYSILFHSTLYVIRLPFGYINLLLNKLSVFSDWLCILNESLIEAQTYTSYAAVNFKHY